MAGRHDRQLAYEGERSQADGLAGPDLRCGGRGGPSAIHLVGVAWVSSTPSVASGIGTTSNLWRIGCRGPVP